MEKTQKKSSGRKAMAGLAIAGLAGLCLTGCPSARGRAFIDQSRSEMVGAGSRAVGRGIGNAIVGNQDGATVNVYSNGQTHNPNQWEQLSVFAYDSFNDKDGDGLVAYPGEYNMKTNFDSDDSFNIGIIARRHKGDIIRGDVLGPEGSRVSGLSGSNGVYVDNNRMSLVYRVYPGDLPLGENKVVVYINGQPRGGTTFNIH